MSQIQALGLVRSFTEPESPVAETCVNLNPTVEILKPYPNPIRPKPHLVLDVTQNSSLFKPLTPPKNIQQCESVSMRLRQAHGQQTTCGLNVVLW